MLDVWLGGRFFVLAYIPSHDTFGVDEIGDDDGLGNHDRFGSTSFDDARDELLRWLRTVT